MESTEHSQGDHAQTQWEELVSSTFDRPVPKAPAVADKLAEPPKPASIRHNKWPWMVLAALILSIAAVCIVPWFWQAETDAAIPAELLVCKEALDQWQALDCYKITGTFYRYGNSTGATQWNEQYWVCGENWVMFNSAYKHLTFSSIPRPAGYMYRDGNYYITYSDTDPTWSPYDTEQEDNRLEIWPMTFSWDACELIYTGTTREDYATIVRFSVIDRTKETALVCNVEFQMALSGKLKSVAVIQTRSDGVIAKDVYLLSSSDAVGVTEYVTKQPLVELTDTVLPEASE